MPVYLIRAGEAGPVKIGKADDPYTRLGDLQVGNWEKLTLLRIWEGGVVEEAALHEMFDDLWIRGDWYSFSARMLGDVGLRVILPDAVTPSESLAELSRPEVHPFRVWLRAAGIVPSTFAAKLGVSHTTVSRWLAYLTFPSSEMLQKIEQLTDGAVTANDFRARLIAAPAEAAE